MQTIIAIIILSIIALLVFGFITIWLRLNERCIERYGYKPMNNWNLILSSAAMICIWVGSFMVASYRANYNHRAGFGDYTDTPITNKINLSYASLAGIAQNQKFWLSMEGNGVVVGLVGLLASGMVFLRISYKTSLISGIVASFLLAVIGSLFFIVLIIVILGIMFAAENTKRKVVVVSRY